MIYRYMSEVAVQRYMLASAAFNLCGTVLSEYIHINLNNVASLSDTKHLVLLDDVHHHQ